MTYSEQSDPKHYLDDTDLSPSNSLDIDPAEFDEDPDDNTVERRGLTPKQIMGMAGAAIALIAVGIGVGSKMGASSESRPTNSEAPAKPAETQIPRAAELFTEEFGSRYPDPVSTWYAAEALKATTGKNYVLTDSAIRTHEKAGDNRTAGNPFGFEQYKLADKSEITEDLSIEVFNNYTCKQVTQYMNLLAKNPTPEAVVIIDKQFMTYCSDSLNADFPDLAYTEDDRFITTFVETIKTVVEKYGSSANYTMQPGTISNTEPNKTSFEPYSFNRYVNDNEETIGSNIVGDVAITIETYDKKGVAAQSTEILPEAYMRLTKQRKDDRGFSYLSIGELKLEQ